MTGSIYSTPSSLKITGDSEAVKNALFVVSAIMYKFSPREEISLETTVPELPPIIIPSDVPIYPAGSFYPGADAIVPPRNLPPLVSATTQVPSLHGFVDTDGMWPMYSSALPVVSGYGGPSRLEELVVQVLCLSDKIGRVIGKGGSTIKNIRQASGANIDVNDKKHGTEECIITVSSTESIEDVIKSASVEAVLLLQNKISDEDDERVNMRLLVPSKVIGCLIGKNGSIINEMRKKTKADVRISKGEKPKHAAASDELVEVIGEVDNSRDAILQIILRLREHILKDKDGSHTNPPLDSRYSSSLPVSSVVPGVRQAGTLGYDHDQRAEAERGLGMFPVSSLYGYNSFQAGDGAYNFLSSDSSKGYTRLDEGR
ncbi:KH domain-containing protein [Iris pallida]|uniref:KH domain-containing protein n=2 Tax=Iris pallida TaxID=29817 RepID=A0AAX6H6C8_IRIPA|nr:KH domain-containing protein [Iris pallida]